MPLHFPLMIIEDAIEGIGSFFGLLTAFPVELAGIVHALAGSIGPAFHIVEPLLERFSLFCHFGVGDRCFGIAVVDIDTKRDKP